MKSINVYLAKKNVQKLERICENNKEFLSFEVIDASDKNFTDITLYYTNVESLVIAILNGLDLPNIHS